MNLKNKKIEDNDNVWPLFPNPIIETFIVTWGDFPSWFGKRSDGTCWARNESGLYTVSIPKSVYEKYKKESIDIKFYSNGVIC